MRMPRNPIRGGTPILLPEPPDSKRRKSLTGNEDEITNRGGWSPMAMTDARTL